jgi:hypothetical protein
MLGLVGLIEELGSLRIEMGLKPVCDLERDFIPTILAADEMASPGDLDELAVGSLVGIGVCIFADERCRNDFIVGGTYKQKWNVGLGV